MQNKERVLKTLNHEQADRVPFFYWAVPEFTEKMMHHLGLSDRDALLDYLDVDFRTVEPAYVGPDLITGTNGEAVKKDIWGVGYRLVGHGDLKYWEACHFPLQGVTDLTALDDYPWPTVDLFDFSVLDAQFAKYKEYATMTAPGFSSPGLFRIVQRLIGREGFLDVLMYHPKFFKALTQRVADFYLEFIERFFAVAGDRLDFIRVADDFGGHDGLIVSNEIWEEVVRPVFERYLEIPRKHGTHLYLHSCGGVRKLLPEFISLGADVLDPIQTRAAGMAPEGLKKDFGPLITFCGALDEELLLRQATPRRVEQGVKDLLEVMAPGGGFILGPSHKIKVETPVENVMAMYKAAGQWRYS